MNEKGKNAHTLAYLSEWNKRTDEQQKRYIIVSVAAFTAVVIVCVVLFSWFRKDSYERTVSQNMNFVMESAVRESQRMEEDLNDAVTLIRNFANQYAALRGQHSDGSIEERLSLLSDDSLFDRIAYMAPDGTDTSLEGVTNVADREYFQRGMMGEAGCAFIPKSRVTNKSAMVFFAPIFQDGRIDGVMAGFYEQEHIDRMFSYRLFDYSPETYLLDKKGTVIASTNDLYRNANLLSDLSGRSFIGDTSYQQLLQEIEDENKRVITFNVEEDKGTAVGVVSQFSNKDWMVLSILPTEITSNMTASAVQAGLKAMLYVIAAFMSLTAVLLGILLYYRKRLIDDIDLATKELEQSLLYDQKQSYIIEMLGNSYSSIYLVNVSSGNYERISEREQSVACIPEAGSWENSYGLYVDKFVAPAYKADMRRFLNVDSFANDEEENEGFSVEYQRTDKLWRRVMMIPAERDENGKIVSLIFAAIKIDAEKKKELEAQNALKDAYEAAQLASRAKTTFLSNMSHDIRTPLNAIVGMTAIAAAHLKEEKKVSDCLKKITVSSKHLLGLINEVLDMSKIESGKVDLNEEEFNIADMIDSMVLLHQPLIREKGHALTVHINHLKHEKVIGDSTRLQQVLTNLLSNAVKYTPSNGRIELSITEKETNKPTVGWYEVEVKDNGIGMSEEYQRTLFEPFSRARDERIAGIQGTGLGMPIAKNIIRMMNGDITVKSRINEGSSFTVTFALRLQKEKEVDYDSFVNLPVLVVDDDPEACESTCEMLDGLGMKSEYVTGGREAVEKTAAHHEAEDDYFALIVDWKMPDMNGLETTREIRRRVGNDVPIIVISAYDWQDIEQEAREAGVNAFLSKPVFRSKIVDLFASLVAFTKEKAADMPVSGIHEHSFGGKRILIAEDNELNREIAVELLSMMELELETVENGKLCVERFSAAPEGYFDLILMDIQMPVMTGYEAASAIRALAHPDAKRIPIIAMTANAFSTDVRAAFDAGMNGHLSKPIEIDKVIETFEKHLK